MKLSISQLAFTNTSIEEALSALKDTPIQGVEILPTLLWKKPLESSKEERREIRDLFKENHIKVAGLQSLLYDQEDLQLFGDSISHQKLQSHLAGMIELCSDLGGEFISFGSFKNRLKNNRHLDECKAIAIEFFKSLSLAASRSDIKIHFEPVAREYGCDFVNLLSDAISIAKEVNHPNFGALLDTGTMIMENESIPNDLSSVSHLHVNDPKMAAPSDRHFKFQNLLFLLREKSYSGWVTMEFLSDDFESDAAHFIRQWNQG